LCYRVRRAKRTLGGALRPIRRVASSPGIRVTNFPIRLTVTRRRRRKTVVREISRPDNDDDVVTRVYINNAQLTWFRAAAERLSDGSRYGVRACARRSRISRLTCNRTNDNNIDGGRKVSVGNGDKNGITTGPFRRRRAPPGVEKVRLALFVRNSFGICSLSERE